MRLACTAWFVVAEVARLWAEPGSRVRLRLTVKHVHEPRLVRDPEIEAMLQRVMAE